MGQTTEVPQRNENQVGVKRSKKEIENIFLQGYFINLTKVLLGAYPPYTSYH